MSDIRIDYVELAVADMARAKATAELQEALREQERALQSRAAEEMVEAVQAAKEKAAKEAAERLKPQLQKQEAVEEANSRGAGDLAVDRWGAEGPPEAEAARSGPH